MEQLEWLRSPITKVRCRDRADIPVIGVAIDISPAAIFFNLCIFSFSLRSGSPYTQILLSNLSQETIQSAKSISPHCCFPEKCTCQIYIERKRLQSTLKRCSLRMKIQYAQNKFLNALIQIIFSILQQCLSAYPLVHFKSCLHYLKCLIQCKWYIAVMLVAQSCLILQPCGLQPIRPLCPWNYPDKNWSGLPFPYSRDLLDPGIGPGSPALQEVSLPFTSEPQRKSIIAI